jgi:hypothetical protein
MLAQYRSSLAHLGGRHPMLEFALHHHRVHDGTETGAPLGFRNMPFLIEWYAALWECEDLVAKKCTQVGFTESVLLFMAAQAGVRGRRHATILPDDDMVKTFVQERIQPMVDRVPKYQELARVADRAKSADNLRLRHFGRGTWRFLGTRNPGKLSEFATDSFCIDEVDDCTQRNLSLLIDRTRSSQNPQHIRLGNPKLETGGVSRLYKFSDQREWFVRCTRCSHRQRLDWFDHIVEEDEHGRWVPRDRERAKHLTMAVTFPPPNEDIRPVCTRCNRPWTRARSGGQWVIGNPGVARRGYHVNQLDNLGHLIWPLFKQWIEAQDNPDDLKIFHSNVLGQVHIGRGAKLNPSDLDQCVGETTTDYTGGDEYREREVIAGVDVGKVLNFSISVVESRVDEATKKTQKLRRAVRVGAVATWEELGELLQWYHVDLCCIDIGPEFHKVREFRDWCHRNTSVRIWLVEYFGTDKVTVLPYGMTFDHGACKVRVHKTSIMDQTFGELRRGHRVFPSDINLTLGWVNQMCVPVRTLLTTKKGERFSWERGSKRDDYRQVECYERVALDLISMSAGFSDVSLGRRGR